jgi:hypothetical protein
MAEKLRQNHDARLVEALARGVNQTEAARLSGVSVRTIARRLGDPEFRNQVDEFRAQMLESASGRLADLLDRSISTLARLMADDAPPGVRLSAAKAAIEHAVRLREAFEIERRLRELENRLRQEDAT